MKKFLTIIVLLAVAGGAGTWYYRTRMAPAPAQQPEAAMRPITVSRGEINLQVPTTGRVTSNLDVEIKSKASGQIINLPFDVSDAVTSGALLCELDPVDERRNVSQREAALISANARLIQAQEELKIATLERDTRTSTVLAELAAVQIRQKESRARLARAEDLFGKQLVSREELDAARTEAANSTNALLKAETAVIDVRSLTNTLEVRRQNIRLNESSVKQAEVELENAMQRLRETRIFAPMDGVLTSRPVQPGQIIASGVSNVGGGTTLMTLSDLSVLFVNANVDESDIGKVKTGQGSVITADAFPGKRFHGKIMRIASKGVINSNVVTFEVKIEVTGEGVSVLRPEMTANVTIQADRREEALLLPNEAIQYDRRGYFVEVVGDDPSTRTVSRVSIGITDGLNTEVIEGVQEGQEVALPAVLQSRWVQGQQGQQQGGANLTRGMQRATMSLGGVGGGGRGGRR